MTTISTTITGTIDPDTKALTLVQRIAVYEVRAIALSLAAGTFPAGTYRLALVFGGKTVALSALAATGGTLAGTLNLSTTQIEALFAVLPNGRIPMHMLVWDTTGKVLYGRQPVYVYRNEYDAETAQPTPVQNCVIAGTVDLTAGERDVTVDVSALGVLATGSLAASVLVPSGGDNIFVVASTLSASALTFKLSSPPAVAGYKLTWMVAQ